MSGNTSGSNNYATRYYLAVTKHLNLQNIGEWGVHVAFVYGNAKGMEHYKRPSFGTNFRFAFPETSIINKAANGLKDRKSTRLNSSHIPLSRMPSSA